VCLTYLKRAWEELPDDKNKYDESYLIVVGILTTSLLIDDHDGLREWVDLIFSADPERIDSGEREMWAGRVAYELGELDKAKKHFKIADKKSRGRCFNLKNDGKYLRFYQET
jgi:hypothetical protein